MEANRAAQETECQVIPILFWQSTAKRYFWCRQCSYQFQELVAVTMRPELLTCQGCGMDGFCVGQAGGK